MAARLNFVSSMRRDHVGGTVVRNVDIDGMDRIDRYACPRCGARCEPDRGIGCGHHARNISSRIYHSGGITR
ncbi:hypothetical protein HRJ34_14785 [Rhizorhabdus wittichii]|uniref:Uncharacterized protein n=1 Tax=Rhizorhabdus wittichii TaxID=160791 RepID=A0A975CYM4_9SPHN|nr:hypothetical protein [Rhizorhabdus wittichii]QTH19641.1 hypothetical protein HRJ34_14785 [Rhizorhabdus wittichii]